VSAVDSLEWRPLELSDVTRWRRLLDAIRVVDGTSEYVTEEELIQDLSEPLVDLRRGSVAAFDQEAMVAYALLNPRPHADPVHEMRFDAGVTVGWRRRGLGTRLVDWVERAGTALHRSRFPDRPLVLSGSSPATNAIAISLLEGSGYEPVRYFNGMVIDLSLPIEQVELAPGCEIVPWSEERSFDALSIRNDAFRDHRGSTESTSELWAYYMASPFFRPDFSFLALCGGEAAGFVMAQEFESGPEKGRDLYVALVGTRRAHRKKGIATALVMTTLNESKRAGFSTASLEVDSESPTGALSVYEKIGFAVDHRSVTLNKQVGF
jgi:mycothiol synthase